MSTEAASADRQELIRVERIRALFRPFNSRRLIVGSSTAGAILIAVTCTLLSEPAYPASLLWVALVALADVGLTFLDRRFQAIAPSDAEMRRWGWARSVANGLRALCWSLGPWLLHHPHGEASLVLPVWGLVSLLAASVYTASPFFPCLLLTIVGGIVPALAWLLLEPSDERRLAALLLIFTTPFLVYIGILGRRSIGNLIDRRLEIADLLARQERQNEIIEQAMAERTRFFSAASHDLRQPLQALGFYTALLAAKDDKDAEQRDIVDRILECTGSLNRQFQSILGLAMADALMPETAMQPIDLNPLLGRVLNGVRPAAEEKGLELRCVSTSLWATANEEVLERILQNLLVNAVRYTTEGKILLGVRRRSNAVEICVADTGIGIAKENLGRIFDDYFQVNNPARDRDKGFGLGLATVRRLCEKLGWPLRVRSVLARGTVFSIVLPLTEPRPATVAPAPAIDDKALPVSTTVLIVDDDPLVRDAMEKLILSWGFAVKAAATAEEARRHLAVLPDAFHLLIDYRLDAAESGLDFIRSARATNALPPGAVLMTAETDPAIFEQAAELGVPVLRKPVKPIRLRAALTLPSAQECAVSSHIPRK